MKTPLWNVAALALMTVALYAQGTPATPEHHSPQAVESPAKRPASNQDSDDIEQLRSDVQRLKVVLNQMRTNLAFVQTSQTPLKHQFELETDAWQVLIEQMERRLQRMGHNATSKSNRGDKNELQKSEARLQK